MIDQSKPWKVSANYNTQYRLADGSVSTYSNDFNSYLDTIMDTPSLSAATAIVYGAIPETAYNSLVSTYTAITNAYDCYSVDLSQNDLSAGSNDSWYYANFQNYSANSYSGYSFDYVVSSLTSGSAQSFTGTVSGNVYNFSGTAYPEYNNMVVATLRSRGISLYNNSSTNLLMKVGLHCAIST